MRFWCVAGGEVREYVSAVRCSDHNHLGQLRMASTDSELFDLAHLSNHTEKIKSQVLEKVGKPPRLHRVEVCRHHDGNYRVNIWEQLEQMGDSTFSMAVQVRSSYYLKASDTGEIICSKTVTQIFDEHCQSKLGVNKARSCRNYRQAQKVFEDYVGSETLIADVTAGDVENFISEMKREGREASTIGNYLKRTRQAFQYAADHEWIEKNPIKYSGKDFKIVKTMSKQKIQEKLVTPETIDHLLNEPHPFEFKLLLNLVRWTGCRIAEALILRWSDVSFQEDDPRNELREKDTAHSGTDRSKNPTRTVPLFTELRPVLEQARELAAEDEEYVFNELGDLRQKPDFELTDANGQRIREGRYETNVGGHLTRAIRKAGLEVWPQPWHAIRDFRLNELSRLG